MSDGWGGVRKVVRRRAWGVLPEDEPKPWRDAFYNFIVTGIDYQILIDGGCGPKRHKRVRLLFFFSFLSFYSISFHVLMRANPRYENVVKIYRIKVKNIQIFSNYLSFKFKFKKMYINLRHKLTPIQKFIFLHFFQSIDIGPKAIVLSWTLLKTKSITDLEYLYKIPKLSCWNSVVQKERELALPLTRIELKVNLLWILSSRL